MLSDFENSSASSRPSDAAPDAEQPVVRRQASEAVRNGQKAVALLRPIFSRMGSWQAEAIKLDTMAKRLHMSGRHDQDVKQQIRELLAVVNEERERFETSLTCQPEKIAAHSRVRDARCSLRSIAERLQVSLQ